MRQSTSSSASPTGKRTDSVADSSRAWRGPTRAPTSIEGSARRRLPIWNQPLREGSRRRSPPLDFRGEAKQSYLRAGMSRTTRLGDRRGGPAPVERTEQRRQLSSRVHRGCLRHARPARLQHARAAVAPGGKAGIGAAARCTSGLGEFRELTAEPRRSRFRVATGILALPPAVSVCADCRGPALAVGPAAERWAGRVVLVANLRCRQRGGRGPAPLVDAVLLQSRFGPSSDREVVSLGACVLDDAEVCQSDGGVSRGVADRLGERESQARPR